MSAQLLHLQDDIVRIVVDLRPPALHLSIRGELDLSSHTLLEAVNGLDLTGVGQVTIDLTDLAFCDLAGLRAIALLHDTQRLEHRAVRLVQPPRCVVRLAQIVGRTDLLGRPDLRAVPGDGRDASRATGAGRRRRPAASDLARLRPAP